MRKINRIAVIVILAATLSAIALFAAGCNEKLPEPPKSVTLNDITFPALREGQLDIEWLGGTYYATRSTLIYFHGEMPNGADDSATFALPAEEYPDDIISENYKRFTDRNLSNLRDLAYYWEKAGFNVGIFHYEQFADDLVSNVYAKIFNNDYLSYKNEGQTITREASKLSHSLTEVFAARYLAYMADKPLRGSEIRFVGNGAGAAFALSAAEYLHNYYAAGQIDGKFLPRRVTLCDPYFSNERADIAIDWKGWEGYPVADKQIATPLEYASKSIAALNAKGMIFEYIESDPDYSDSYGEPYSEADISLHSTILSNTASLDFRQSYSSRLSEYYLAQNRISLDWYLYSMNGSDRTLGFDSDSNIRKDITYPILDDYYQTSDRNSLVYGLSAWTPTTYIKAVVGHKFGQYSQPVDGESAPYVLTKFQSENYQKSDIETPFICGYVFLDENSNQKIDDGFGAFVPNVEITVNYKDGYPAITITTDESGFYKLELKDKAYNNNNISSLDITVKQPSHRYQFVPVVNEGFYDNYLRMEMANIGNLNDNVNLYSYTKTGPKILNCGLKYSK